MPLLSRCCCCCGLRTGALILGWLGLIGEIGTLISGIEMLTVDVEEQYNDVLTAFKQNMTDDSYKEMSEVSHKASQMMKQAGHWVGWSMISGGVIGIILNVALIYGAMKRKRLFLVPWLVSDMITIIGLALFILVLGFIFLIMKETVGFGILIFAIGIPIIVLQLYFWICVQSLYRKFTQEESLNKRSRHEEIGFLPTAPYSNQPYNYKYAG